MIEDGKSETGPKQLRTWRTRSMLPHKKERPRVTKRRLSYISSNGKKKEKMFVYVPGTYISPLGLAFEGGVSSNPSSRDRLFLRTAHIPFGSSTRKRCELEPFQQREVIIGDGKSETGHDQVRTWLTRSMLPRQKGRPRVKKRKRTYISSNGKSKRICRYRYQVRIYPLLF